MSLNINEIKVGDSIFPDKGKYKNIDFTVVDIKGKSVIIRFEKPIPGDKDIKVPIDKLEKNYSTKTSYYGNLFANNLRI